MSRKEKLRQLLFLNPVVKDFEFRQLETLMKSYGFEIRQKGRTSGSSMEFFHRQYKLVLEMHRPHKGKGKKCLLNYQIKAAREVILKVEEYK